MKKKIVWLLVSCLMVAALLLMSCAPAEAPEEEVTEVEPIELSYGGYVSATGIMGQTYIWFMDEVERRTNGRVVFPEAKRYHLQTLLKASEIPEGVMKGIVDIGDCTFAYAPELLPEMVHLPMFYLSDDVGAAGLAKFEHMKTDPILTKKAEELGIRFLFCVTQDPMILVSKTPVTKKEDLKGMKFRAVGSYADFFAKFGAQITPIRSAELYEAMERGMIDGLSAWPFYAYIDYKMYEVAPYLVDLRQGYYWSQMIYINLNTWNSFPDDIKKIVDEVAEEAVKTARWEIGKPSLEGYIDELVEAREKGMKIELIRLSPEEAKRWKAIAEELTEEILIEQEAKGMKLREIYNRQLEMLKKYEGTPTPYENPFDKLEKALK